MGACHPGNPDGRPYVYRGGGLPQGKTRPRVPGQREAFQATVPPEDLTVPSIAFSPMRPR
jgi:hypothetical protein